MATPFQLATAAEFDAHALPSEAFVGIDITVKNAWLQWASSVCLGFVQKRKALPLLSWGSDLKNACCEIAAYKLMGKRGYAPGSGGNQVLRDGYDDAIAWLRDISRGIAELVDCVDSSSTPTVDEAGPLTASDPIVNWNYQTRGRCSSPFNGSGL